MQKLVKLKTGKKLEKINEQKDWVLEKINKIYKPLARPSKKEKTQLIISRIKQDTTTELQTPKK